MRKREKKIAEEFLALLESAHLEIKSALDKGKMAQTLGLLEQCQQGAIQLGELIENTEGEECPAVGFIEAYCEAVYQIFEEVGQGLASNPGKGYKSLKKRLIAVENSLKTDVPTRLEVVFLPYKASMWDSLESVWQAADADPDCNAYVIPIPYYDKNPDGSFREMHYEGGEYPKDVPVIWYKDYDFAKRRPDMVFIHNPYDACNHVTSVESFFYSENLKRYTDQLIYIPYFVLGEVSPDDENALAGMTPFCTEPGVFNADKVIVQSEKMRQAYINILCKSAGEQTRPHWEKVVLGLGSPKFDKAVASKKGDFDIPEDWLRVIRKPDGSWKKIVFYNTSVTALLAHGEKMLEKIQDALHVFEENQAEIALLWRPHPLVQATIQSMRPQLRQKYQLIVGQYRAGQWGIYDDSADFNRAIALSDAYYGDPSSAAQLYEQNKELLMFQSAQVLCASRENNCGL